MQRVFVWLMMTVMSVVVIAEPSYAQFPESLEAQQEFIRKQNEAAQKAKDLAKDARNKKPTQAEAKSKPDDKATDPRPTKSPQSGRDSRPKKDPVSTKTAPNKAKPKVTRVEKKSAAVCDVKVPRDCSEALSAANRSCSDQAGSCKDRVSSTEDQSCVFIRCDVTRAECMKDALDDYIGCMDAGLEKSGAN